MTMFSDVYLAVVRAARLAAWLLLLPVAGAVAIAEPQGNSLARFLPGDASLESRIRFPDLPGEIVEWINCTAMVPTGGRITHNFCFAHRDDSEWFKMAIHDAIGEIRLQPAVVDGKPARVAVNYRVLFLSTGNSRDIRVFQNWGHDAKRLGHDYLAPQRHGRFHPYPMSCYRRQHPLVARVTVVIDAMGRPREGALVEFAEGSRPSRSCARELRRLHERASYIPAELDGKPVEASYIELWGDYQRAGLSPAG